MESVQKTHCFKTDFFSHLSIGLALAFSISGCASGNGQLESMLRAPASETSIEFQPALLVISGYIAPSSKCFQRRRDTQVAVIGPGNIDAVACISSKPIVDGHFSFNCQLKKGDYKLTLFEIKNHQLIDSKEFKVGEAEHYNFDLNSCR